MAIAVTNKTSGLDDTNTTGTYTTGSVPFVTARLYLVTFASHSAANSAHSATGTGITLTEVLTVTFNTIAAPTKRLTVFRCMPTSDQTTTVSLDQSTDSMQNGRWIIDEFTGIDTSGTNGSGAIVQSVSNRADSGTSLTVTLAAFGSTDNVGFGAFSHAANEVTTPGVGFTELGDVVGTESPTTSVQSEWKLNDNTVDATWSTTGTNAGIGIEVKAATGGGAPAVARRMLLGVGT